MELNKTRKYCNWDEKLAQWPQWQRAGDRGESVEFEDR